MSFGVGLGDILIVVRSGLNIYGAIRGSPAEHKELASEVQTLRRSFEDFNRLIIEGELLGSVAESVEQQLSSCFPLLQSLDEDTTAYLGKGLSLEGKYKRRNDLRGELRWVIYQRDKLFKLQDDLKRKINFLNSILCPYNTRRVENFYVLDARFINGVPAMVDEWSGIKTIRFIDALERKRIFPFDMCNQWKTFQGLIKLSFNDSVGKNWVDAGRYRIVDETKGTTLTAKGWGNSIMPDMTVSMAVLIITERKATDTSEHNCPSCGFRYGGAKSEELERVRCKGCGNLFQISSKPRTEELGDNEDGVGAEDIESSTEDKQLGKTNELFNTDELRVFRRLHVEVFEPVRLRDKTAALTFKNPWFFSCSHPNCQAKFPYASKLKVHERIHNPPQFQCCFCNERYKQLRILKKHTKRKHPNGENEVPAH